MMDAPLPKSESAERASPAWPAFCSCTAMEGVPFMISEKFACASEGMQPVDLLGITIKSLAEIEKEVRASK
ncbi:hypothetical protein lerEdw1_011242 [Lerista edwardsae]|nr:hypothetical protein lerEdw1_011242 [Lerista edwardsae]